MTRNHCCYHTSHFHYGGYWNGSDRTPQETSTCPQLFAGWITGAMNDSENDEGSGNGAWQVARDGKKVNYEGHQAFYIYVMD